MKTVHTAIALHRVNYPSKRIATLHAASSTKPTSSHASQHIRRDITHLQGRQCVLAAAPSQPPVIRFVRAILTPPCCQIQRECDSIRNRSKDTQTARGHINLNRSMAGQTADTAGPTPTIVRDDVPHRAAACRQIPSNAEHHDRECKSKTAYLQRVRHFTMDPH